MSPDHLKNRLQCYIDSPLVILTHGSGYVPVREMDSTRQLLQKSHTVGVLFSVANHTHLCTSGEEHLVTVCMCE